MGAEHDLEGDSEAVESLATVAGEASRSGELAEEFPAAVVDAMVETAWAFPGLRISSARASGPHQLKFMASAAVQDVLPLTGSTLGLAASPRLARLLARGESLQVEDVHSDSRLPVSPPVFEEHGVGAALIVPILRREQSRLLGALMFDAPRPRTWSSREELALERVAPLLQLALENRELRLRLDDASALNAMHERQAAAIRGVVDSAVHDGRVLLDALLQLQRGTPSAGDAETIAALECQLFDALGDLAALPDRIASRRDRENLDLNDLIMQAAPVLRAVLGSRYRLLVRTDPLPVWVRANRTGVDRMLRTIVTHTTSQGSGPDVVLRAYTTPGGAVIEVSGDAIGTDDRLLSALSNYGSASPDDLGIDLWQARTEALLNDAAIRYRADTDGTKILIELRPRA